MHPSPAPVADENLDRGSISLEQANLFSLKNAAERLGVSVDLVRRLASSNDIATITIGARRMVPAHELQRVATEGVGRPRKRTEPATAETVPAQPEATN